MGYLSFGENISWDRLREIMPHLCFDDKARMRLLETHICNGIDIEK
jgi:hypothetical protein